MTVNYVYDGDGRRVQKMVTGGPTTNYVYDAQGNLSAEYSTAPNSDVGTQYLTADHLGSTRLVTTTVLVNSQPTPSVISRSDYLPFGQEIPTTWGNRAGYQPDPSQTMKFTGKERDAEIGLDYFGARYFSGAHGRFTSPDDFFKDSHVADPQSWNKYAYARNNPLRYVDPRGESATVSTNCTTDDHGSRTCTVNVSASIAIYAQADSHISPDALAAAAGTIKGSIETAWTGSFTQDGVTYDVTTHVSVSVAGSQEAAMSSGAQNVIGLSSGDAAPGADSFVNARSSWTAIKGGPDTGVWNIHSLGSGVGAHEFTHLLGTANKEGSVLSNTNILSDTSIPHSATSRDFGWGIREATSGVNNWVNSPRQRSLRHGEVWDKPSVYSNRTNVGAPFLWWK